jgi:dihydrofolate reductase
MITSKIILYIASSLDGFIAGRNDDISWLDAYQVEGEDYGYSEFLKTIDIIVVGSKTYEQVLSFGGWPYEGIKTYVMTKRQLEPEDKAKVEFYSGDLDSFVPGIKRESHKDIWLVGGASLAQSFLKHGSIDEMIISIIPVILGDGISLFGRAQEEFRLELLRSGSYDNGIVQLHYKLE